MPAIRIMKSPRLLDCDSGATSIEYALLASLVAMVILGAVTGLGGAVADLFSSVASAF